MRSVSKIKGLSIKGFIAKNLLNSLYGRLGMHDIDTKIVLVDKVKENEIINKKDWDIIIKVNDNKSLVKYNSFGGLKGLLKAGPEALELII